MKAKGTNLFKSAVRGSIRNEPKNAVIPRLKLCLLCTQQVMAAIIKIL